MKRFTRSTCALAIALAMGAPAAALANGPSFDHVGVGYVNFDFDGESVNGYSVDFEKSLSDNFFIGADYFRVQDSSAGSIGGQNFSSRIRLGLLNANVGYKFYTTDTLTVYGSAGLTSVDTKVQITTPDFSINESDSDTGWNVQLGFRTRLTDSIELDAYVRHIDIDGEDDQLLGISGRFHITSQLSLGLGYTRIDSDLDYVSLTARFHF